MEKVKLAKEPSFKQMCCPDPRSGKQLDRDVSSKGRTGSEDSVSTLTPCVNLHHTTLFRGPFKNLSLRVLTRWSGMSPPSRGATLRL